jgi:SAM-dependent methyltransferase
VANTEQARQVRLDMGTVNDTSYESFAEKYLSTSNDNWVLNCYERPFMTEQLPNVYGLTVLDLGCASGYFSRYCLDRGAEVMCVDISPKMVEHTLKLCDSKVRGHVHDIAEPMRFIDSDSVDIIICSLVLHYVANWEDTLNEFHRILKKGGKCLVSTHHPINDYMHFNQEDYFLTRLIEDEWKNLGKPLRVKYYVRPLSEYIQPMLSCKLRLAKVAEPMPSAELEELDKAFFNGLKQHPLFLFFVLEKE